ncbi:hypothetical protein PPERSA_11129 [Pseudocohnilembus persalinus]|uniref:Uncharacterized protein n=1 Tax=Pseudocohnilembus persalinus TaxID=266149 RepID=A0A0V0QZ34_PSEPJ|nr:hypothetical protein PPERSA_11129 [Pseudocohnilembus persalinus]|eukprot:KRX07580.1 hypothetical protein PPERSA_11129 [Pseudocohnilembus persalinus]
MFGEQSDLNNQILFRLQEIQEEYFLKKKTKAEINLKKVKNYQKSQYTQNFNINCLADSKIQKCVYKQESLLQQNADFIQQNQNLSECIKQQKIGDLQYDKFQEEFNQENKKQDYKNNIKELNNIIQELQNILQSVVQHGCEQKINQQNSKNVQNEIIQEYKNQQMDIFFEIKKIESLNDQLEDEEQYKNQYLYQLEQEQCLQQKLINQIYPQIEVLKQNILNYEKEIQHFEEIQKKAFQSLLKNTDNFNNQLIINRNRMEKLCTLQVKIREQNQQLSQKIQYNDIIQEEQLQL